MGRYFLAALAGAFLGAISRVMYEELKIERAKRNEVLKDEEV